MPCYQIIECSAKFKIENLEFLKRALIKIGWVFEGEIYNGQFSVRNEKGQYNDRVIINFDNNTINNWHYF